MKRIRNKGEQNSKKKTDLKRRKKKRTDFEEEEKKRFCKRWKNQRMKNL